MSRRFLAIGGLWLTLRVVLSLAALAGSASRPQTELERMVSPWSVSAPIGDWAKRVFLDPWQRWDSEYYLKIAERGYRTDDGTAQFHPLYPWTGRVAGFLLGNTMLGLLAVNSICGLAFLLVLTKLVEQDLEQEASLRASTFFLHWPGAFILFAPYSEGLFLLCSATVFLMARRGSWWLAGLAGGLAALTRQQGIFLLLPLAWEFWEASGRDLREVLAKWRNGLAMLLVPSGLIAWIIYRGMKLADVAVDWHSPQTWLYGLLISRNAMKVVPDQGFVFPWKALAAAFQSPRSTTIIDLVFGSCFLLLLIFGARFLWKLRPSYLIYSGLILLVSFSYYTGAIQPYMGLSRHCLLAFPLFIPLAAWVKNTSVERVLVGIGLLGLTLASYCYSAQILWVP